MAFHIKQLFPGRTGSRAALHDLEAAVMDVVWTEPSDEFSVWTVVSGLRSERDLAYTTVMTTMDRLAKRELLLRRKEARAWIYRAAMPRADFLDLVGRQALAGLQGRARRSALQWLIEDVTESDREQLDVLAALIEAKRAERGQP